MSLRPGSPPFSTFAVGAGFRESSGWVKCVRTYRSPSETAVSRPSGRREPEQGVGGCQADIALLCSYFFFGADPKESQKKMEVQATDHYSDCFFSTPVTSELVLYKLC